jgi:phosphohistidine phosphatase
MMERRLILMRHAKTEWARPGESDHARALTADGCHAAELMARQLSELGWSPEQIRCSDARRTRDTARYMAPLFPSPPQTVTHHCLYTAGRESLWELSASWSPDWTTILIVGHNPDAELLIQDLAGQSLRMNTANAALLIAKRPGTWFDLLGHPTRAWRLVKHLTPPSQFTSSL